MVTFIISSSDSKKADFGYKNYRPYNRGNKLKKVVEQSALVTDRPSLLPLATMDEQLHV